MQEKDFYRALVHSIIEAVALIPRALGAKGVKVSKFTPFIKPEKKIPSDHVPSIEEAILAFGGKGTVVSRR